MIPRKEANNICTGCELCINICPVSAIKMEEDEQGFLYPNVDKHRCIKCDKCLIECPVRQEKNIEFDYSNQKYYAAQIKNTEILSLSSSGGVCFGIAEYTLNHGGAVFGVTIDDSYIVKYDRITKLEDIKNILGSKYVQGQLGNFFKEFEIDVKKGINVAVFGTPCFINAVKTYLKIKKIDHNNIVLCDFVCHGVTSPRIWKDYIDYLGLTKEKYIFRGKTNGWNRWSPEVYLDNKSSQSILLGKTNYIKLYQTGYITRNGCYDCRYCNYERQSDITMGDFWNIGSCFPEMDNDKGTSQVIINTIEGREIWDAIRHQYFYKECCKEDVWQPHLEYPTNVKLSKREKFWHDYSRMSFSGLMDKYKNGSLMGKCKDFVVPLARRTGIYVFLGKIYRKIFVS